MGEGEKGRKVFPYRWGPVARVAISALSVSVPAAASPAATTASWWLAVMVPVTVSVLAGVFTTVILTGQVQTVVLGVSFPRVQPLVQTVVLQIVPAVKQNTHRLKTRTRKCRSDQELPDVWSSFKKKAGANGPPIAWHPIPWAFYVTFVISNMLIYNRQTYHPVQWRCSSESILLTD